MSYSRAEHGRQVLGIEQLPDNIAEYMLSFHSNLQYNVSSTDVENGYGLRIEKRLRIMRPYRRCIRCGYHSLWNPDDSKSKCLRHTYEKGWDTVFSWNPESGVELERAFSIFLESQDADDSKPVVRTYI